MKKNHEDIQLKLLSNAPIWVEQIPVYPIPINKIAEIGYDYFLKSLRIFTISAQDILEGAARENLNEADKERMVYLFFAQNALESPTFREHLLAVFGWITHDCIAVDKTTGFILYHDYIITPKAFSQLQYIVRLRNHCRFTTRDKENPADERTRLLLEKSRQNKQKLRERTPSSQAELTLCDLVSTLSGGLGVPLQAIMEYDLHQFYNQFYRLAIFKDYDIQMQSLMHGANMEGLDIKHWTAKIGSEDWQ